MVKFLTRPPRRSKRVSLSIVIPAYRASRTIGAALLSVMLTRPRNSEVLVLLDGPGTKSKILNWLNQRGIVKVFTNSMNQGISEAMNFLVEKAASPVIARMDADDICLPGRFRVGQRLVEKDRCDFVFGHAVIFGRRAMPFFVLPQFPVPLDSKSALLAAALKNPFVNSTMVFRKSSFEEIGGCSGSIAEDYELFLRAQVRGHRFRVLSRFQVLYRVHANVHTTQLDFASKVESDPKLTKTISEHRNYVARMFGLDPNHQAFEIQVEDLLIKKNFVYRLRVRYLEALVKLVLRWTKI
jgi:glycosyltransferase involved in cell wall biosynthesis